METIQQQGKRENDGSQSLHNTGAAPSALEVSMAWTNLHRLQILVAQTDCVLEKHKALRVVMRTREALRKNECPGCGI